MTALPLSYRRVVIVVQQWQCKCLSVTVPLLFKSAASLIHHWLWGTNSWMLTTISYLEDTFFSPCCMSSVSSCCVYPSLISKKGVKFWNTCPDFFSLSKVFLLPLPSASAASWRSAKTQFSISTHQSCHGNFWAVRGHVFSCLSIIQCTFF